MTYPEGKCDRDCCKHLNTSKNTISPQPGSNQIND